VSWRHIMITKNARLSVKNNQLVIQQDEMYTVPLQDIASILLEAQAITLTGKLLSKCAEKKVAVLTCDDKLIPNGVWTSFNQHSRQLTVLQMQLSVSKPVKKRIWQAIIQQKIKNQAKCLEILNKEGARELDSISKMVESGDRSNRESYAAKRYFTYLFEKGFTRREDDSINRMLNYGYSIMRSAVARSLANFGFLPCLGIFHDNQLNAFNLADDFMEVLRPVVDLYVASNITDEWTTEIRAGLVNLLNSEILIAEEKMSVTTGIDEMVKGLIGAYRQNDPQYIKLPELLPLRVHQYE
jgi:CRISP-associated protein Cas1